MALLAKIFALLFLLLAVYCAMDPFKHSSITEFPNFVAHKQLGGTHGTSTGPPMGTTGAYDTTTGSTGTTSAYDTTGTGLGVAHGTGHHDAQHRGVAGKLGDILGMTGTGTGHHDTQHRGGMNGTGTGHHDEHREGMTGTGTGHHDDQPCVVTSKLGDTLGITGGKIGHHDQQHPGHGGVTGGVLHRSGSSSSSSSEDDGEGGRRKNGMKDKIKEKLPGHKKTNEPTTAAHGYGGPTTTTLGTTAGYGGTGTTGQHPEKGVMEKIKGKMPGQH